MDESLMGHPVVRWRMLELYIEWQRERKFKKTSLPLTFSLTNLGKAIDARLHTAVSVGLVYSMISVHKLDDFMVPRFCWLLFLLHESYNVRVSKFGVRTSDYKAITLSYRMMTVTYLEKHVWCSCFYLGCQYFIPKLLRLDNLFGLSLKIWTNITVIEITGIWVTKEAAYTWMK